MRRTILLFTVMAAALLVGGGVLLAMIGPDGNNPSLVMIAPDGNNPSVGSKSAMRITDLGTLAGGNSFAYGVNTRGQVVGTSVTASQPTATATATSQPTVTATPQPRETNAFLWEAGKMTNLGSLGGNLSQAYGINTRGQVVGSSATQSGAVPAFLWEAGKMTALGSLGGEFSTAGWGPPRPVGGRQDDRPRLLA
jgi:probable HAF family extracellular repeat protein